MIWKLRTQVLNLDKPVFMGIVNVTPDSFSDGGQFFDTDNAVKQAIHLVNQGVGILDLGAESTRPGSDPVSEAEEKRRLLPVVRKLVSVFQSRDAVVPLSIDTTKPAVAAVCLEEGAEIINDVSPETSCEMLNLLQKFRPGYCLMHSQGLPKTMQDHPRYDNVVEEILTSLSNRAHALVTAGIARETLVIDPGLGFGKTTEHNWQLVENMSRFHGLGFPLLVGPSRKRFISTTFSDREQGTRVVAQQLAVSGVHVLRLHSVPTGEFL